MYSNCQLPNVSQQEMKVFHDQMKCEKNYFSRAPIKKISL